MPSDLARCHQEQAAAADSYAEATTDQARFLALLWAQDWIAEEVLLLAEEQRA